MLEMHIRYNANIDNKTYVGEIDLQKVIGCLFVMEINSSGTIENHLHQNFETQIPRNYIPF